MTKIKILEILKNNVATSNSLSIPFEVEVFLWTISIIFGIVSIAFAFIASFYSSRASRDVKQLIKNQWISEHTNQIFFIKLKEIDILTSKLIFKLKKNNDITYFDYSSTSSGCRLHPISQEITKFLNETKFKELMNFYKEEKDLLDKEFFDIVEIEDINKTEKIPSLKIQELINYHLKAKDKIREIIKQYTLISTSE
ncbi:hypothetical protein [[Mycoplasma] mobile]|uniref:Expressed protein n=1 Tax=Mycoplasma mobile (strain ATCC 43663 / 163K / NCTC 11711) TaxID=267748 RepID=Q6KHW5_MYCM1|nr:hypothetical protein [[Mycoplasma] mobile]AAT27811.1 expressed protein [Mycoplasma mobile 163K]